MKIATVVGARPQLIKAAVVSHELKKSHNEILIHTGQHYDLNLSKIFIDELGLSEPDYNLGVGSGTHGYQTGEMLIRLEKVLQEIRPQLILLYGDTNSTLAGALAAVKLQIPVAHVEAGVRHFDRSVPEEVNRVLTDHVSALLFCPTQRAVSNLKKEGMTQGVYWVGDVMYDSILQHLPVAENHSLILNRLNLRRKDYILVTVHRASNTDNRDNLKEIFDALLELPQRVVIPLHPRTRKALLKFSLQRYLSRESNLEIIEPVGYLDFLMLEQHAKMILTDSGGVQKEAYFLGVPCVTLRDYSPWPETVEDGWNRLVQPRKNEILDATARATLPKVRDTGVFGDGKAAGKIFEVLNRWENQGISQ